MATVGKVVTITTTSQSIISIDNVTQYVTLHSKGNTYVGNSAVTSSNGIHMSNDDTLQLTLPEGCDLWAVSNSGTHDLRVLITRVD
jgi:hypothetical protein